MFGNNRENKMHPLPDFDSMWKNYPLGSAAQVKKVIGNKVNQPHIQNTCTIRLSRAFNYSGDPILRPPIRNAVTGADKKWYGYRVSEMDAYLRIRYGEPAVTVEGSPTKLRGAVKGKKGIILFYIKLEDATGHFDIWDGYKPRYGEHFKIAYKVALWPLKSKRASQT